MIEIEMKKITKKSFINTVKENKTYYASSGFSNLTNYDNFINRLEAVSNNTYNNDAYIRKYHNTINGNEIVFKNTYDEITYMNLNGTACNVYKINNLYAVITKYTEKFNYVVYYIEEF